MSMMLDTEYLKMLSAHQLEKFKKKGENEYNFRCPICGDGTHGKTRGYVFSSPKNTGLVYKCHNCGISLSFGKFLEMVSPQLYQEYVFKKLRENQQGNLDFIDDTPKKKVDMSIFEGKSLSWMDSNLEGLIRVDKLDDSHPCKKYVLSRKIPENKFHLLYYCEDFVKYVNKLIPGKINSTNKEERLVIPYFNQHGKMFAFQGRALDPTAKIRYFTIKLDRDQDKIYGLDRVNPSKQIYLVEGPIDSLFLPNAIAMSGSSIKLDDFEPYKSKIIVVYDNEPRNKDVCHQIKRFVDHGFKVCLWESGLPFKDINEAILNGYTQDDLIEIINRDCVQGFNAKLKYNMWTKF